MYPLEVGDNIELTSVTGLIPNGPYSMHPFGIARGGGWVVDVSQLGHDRGFWSELVRRGGYGVTHNLRLSRDDERRFTSTEACEALLAVRYALTMALGRRCDVALPTGWRDERPAWARWTAGSVDSHRDTSTWLDSSISLVQVAELIGLLLQCWSDSLRRETLRYAISYYVQAVAWPEDLGTAAAISGLSLLSFSWLMDERQGYSKTKWKELKTQGQIRALLELDQCRIDPAVPTQFAKLVAVRDRLKREDDKDCDGLGCLIEMRNDVVHPTRVKAGAWSPYEWSEANSLAVHFLELALLAYVGYRGKYHPRVASNRHTGYVEDVPWLSST